MAEYIERERLQEAFNADLQHLQSIDEHTVNLVLIEIDEAPAADVAEVKRGKWIKSHWRNSVSCANCSICRFEAYHYDFQGVQKTYNYCPNCGAKMDGDEE